MNANRTPLDAQTRTAIRVKALQLICKSGFTVSDREDIKQELTLTLLRRRARYDPSRASWNTFASCVINTCAASMIAQRCAAKRNPGNECCSLNEMITDGEGNQVERVATIDAQINRPRRSPEEQQLLAIDVQTVLESLPRKLRRLAECLKTETISEIARRAGVSRKKIYLSVWEIRRRFEEAGLRAYLA